MKKLNLTEVQERQDSKPRPTSGAYVIKIMDVEDVPFDNSTGKGDYLKLSYDIAYGDFKGYYTDMIKNPSNKWSKYPIIIASYSDRNDYSLPNFKSMMTSFSKSNKGFVWRDNEKDLKGKFIGVILREEEREYNGRISVDLRHYAWHSIDRVKSGELPIPEIKKLSTAPTQPTPTFGFNQTSSTGFDFGIDESNPFETQTKTHSTSTSNNVVEENDDFDIFDMDDDNPFDA